jgi:hypothetical protein
VVPSLKLALGITAIGVIAIGVFPAIISGIGELTKAFVAGF